MPISFCRIDSALQGPPIGIKKIYKQTPRDFKLFQNYPNPFNLTTKIKYKIPVASYVKLELFDVEE